MVERQFYDGHNRKVDGSTPTEALLLRHWIRCFTTIISVWWNANKQQIKEVTSKIQAENLETRQL